MEHPSFARWRTLSRGYRPTRFESTVHKFRRLQEANPSGGAKRYDKPDRRIEVDTVTTPNALNMSTAIDDPAELDKERRQERDRQIAFTRSRLSTLKWIKKQARRDFNMIGGTSPMGTSGAGGSDGGRPLSYTARQ